MSTYTEAHKAPNGARPKPTEDAIATEDAATAEATFSDTSGSTTELKARISTQPFELLATAASRVGAVTGALAGTVAFVYVVGGAIMWIRFKSAGLPADQAVSLVPRNDLMVVALRIMVLPAALVGAVFFLLARRERRRVECQHRIPLRYTLSWMAGIAAFVLVVPFTPGALAWPLAAIALWLVWHRCLASACHVGPVTSFPLWKAAAAAALLAAVISLARQFDHPNQLPTATAETREGAKEIGVLVSESGDKVAIGFSRARSIRIFDRSQLSSLVIGPSLDKRAPARSLLSRLLPGQPHWAATPLEIWCGGERYQLFQIGNLCQTQPQVLGIGEVARGGLGVTLRCPEEASDGCSGFLRVLTAEPVRFQDLDRRARAVVGKAAFQVPAGGSLQVRVKVNRRLAELLGGSTVALDAVVSLDLRGDAVIARRRQAAAFTVAEQAQAPAEPVAAAVADDPMDTAPAEAIDPDAPIDLAPPGPGS